MVRRCANPSVVVSWTRPLPLWISCWSAGCLCSEQGSSTHATAMQKAQTTLCERCKWQVVRDMTRAGISVKSFRPLTRRDSFSAHQYTWILEQFVSNDKTCGVRLFGDSNWHSQDKTSIEDRDTDIQPVDVNPKWHYHRIRHLLRAETYSRVEKRGLQVRNQARASTWTEYGFLEWMQSNRGAI